MIKTTKKINIFKNKTILLTGSSGMLGSRLFIDLKKKGYKKILTPKRSELDLLNFEKVINYFKKNKPVYLFIVAAKVGGIKDNKLYPLQYLQVNLEIQNNLFKAAQLCGVKKCIFIGSSCVYPKNSRQPIKESSLLDGKLEDTNEGYALAKIVGIKTSNYYFEQHDLLTVSPMICNMYGTKDSFDLERSHVLSALIKKIVNAKKLNQNTVSVWGTGKPKREFIHVEDASRAVILLFERFHRNEIVNVGSGKEISIKELAKMISKMINFKGKLAWDKSMPDGMKRKILDISTLKKLNFSTKISLERGIKKTILEYKKLNSNF